MERSTRYFLLGSLMLLMLPAAAQDLDSLRRVWSDGTRPDSVRFLACYDLVWDGYLFSDPDSALLLSEDLQRQARSRGSIKFDALAFDLMAVAWYVKGDMRKALSIYAISLPMHEGINNTESVADVIGNMATMHSFLGEHQQALELYDRALRMHTSQADTLGMANDINAMGRVHMVRGDHARAMEHYIRSLQMLHELGNDRGIATGLANLGTVYLLQGDYAAALPRFSEALVIAERLGDLDQVAEDLAQLGICHSELGDTANAMRCYNRALRVNEELGDQRGVVMVINKLADMRQQQQNQSEALALYRRSAEIAARNELPFGHATALVGAATTLLQQGHAREALSTARKADEVARNAEDISLERDAAELLYRTHRTLGNMAEALVHHERYLVLRDSMMREENQRETLRNQFAYDQERKSLADSLALRTERLLHAAAMATQRSRNQLLVGVLVMMVLLAIGIWYRMRFMARANRTIMAAQQQVLALERQREAETVRTRIARDIHDDMGGAITKIGMLSTEARRLIEADTASASETLARISSVSRDLAISLQDVVSTVDPRSDDVAAVVAQARTMAIRLLEGSPLEAELYFTHEGGARSLDPERKRSLLLLLKEAITNVLKHAGATIVRITLATDDERFELIVSDNGKGFDPEGTSSGNGMRNMRARASSLGAELELRTATGQGCTVQVRGPLHASPLLPK